MLYSRSWIVYEGESKKSQRTWGSQSESAQCDVWDLWFESKRGPWDQRQGFSSVFVFFGCCVLYLEFLILWSLWLGFRLIDNRLANILQREYKKWCKSPLYRDRDHEDKVSAFDCLLEVERDKMASSTSTFIGVGLSCSTTKLSRRAIYFFLKRHIVFATLMWLFNCWEEGQFHSSIVRVSFGLYFVSKRRRSQPFVVWCMVTTKKMKLACGFWRLRPC